MAGDLPTSVPRDPDAVEREKEVQAAQGKLQFRPTGADVLPRHSDPVVFGADSQLQAIIPTLEPGDKLIVERVDQPGEGRTRYKITLRTFGR